MATGSSLGPESGTGQSGGPDVTWKKAGLLHLTSTFQRRDEAAWTPHDANAEKKQPPPFKGPTPLPPLFSNRICHVFTQARQLGSHLLEQRSFMLAYKLYSMGQIFCFYYTNQDKNERAYLPQDLSLSRIQITRSKPQVSKHLLQHGKSFIFQLSGGHCNGIKRPMHLHPQVINHYSDFFGNYFFAFSFYHLWMVCPVFAPVQSVPQHALVICFSLSINVRHTHTVVLKLYFTALSLFSCRYWAHGRLVWAFILCHHGIFSPALTSVLSKWLPTCSTLY